MQFKIVLARDDGTVLQVHTFPASCGFESTLKEPFIEGGLALYSFKVTADIMQLPEGKFTVERIEEMEARLSEAPPSAGA